MTASMRNGFLLTIAGAFIAACASQPAPTSPAPAAVTGEKAAADIFAMLEGGGAIHVNSGGECPAELAGFTYLETTIFDAVGNDVACQYRNDLEQRILTLYFNDFGKRMTALEQASEGVAAIRTVYQDASVNEAASDACETSMRSASLIAKLSQIDPNAGDQTVEIDLSETFCAVLDLPTGPTLVAVSAVGDWHIKVRMTGTLKENEAETLGELSAQIIQYERAALRGEAGGDILDLLLEMRSEQQPDETI